MSETPIDRSIKADLLVGLVTATGTGAVGAIVLAAGWIAAKMSVAVLIVVALTVGIVAGLLSASRKRPLDQFQLRRPT